MASFLKKAMGLVFANDPLTPLLKISRKDKPRKAPTTRELIRLESQIGQSIFGAMPHNSLRREFFNLDKNTWIWHEEVRRPDGSKEEITTRYEVQPRGVLKIQPGPRYTYIDGAELQNFVSAAKAYYERVTLKLYRRDPKTGQPL